MPRRVRKSGGNDSDFEADCGSSRMEVMMSTWMEAFARAQADSNRQLVEALVAAQSSHPKSRPSSSETVPASPAPGSAAATHGGNFSKCTARFSGAVQDPNVLEAFIDAIVIYKECTYVSDEHALKGLPMLLEGDAAVWFRGIKSSITNWNEALVRLRAMYGVPRPPHKIFREIFSREQESERAETFIARIRALFAWLPYKLEERACIDIIYGLLNRTIRKRLSRETFSTLDMLSEKCRDLEDTLADTSTAAIQKPHASTPVQTHDGGALLARGSARASCTPRAASAQPACAPNSTVGGGGGGALHVRASPGHPGPAPTAVTSSESEGGPPSLQVLAKSSVYNVGEKKGIYCKGVNLQERLEWYSPLNEIVEGKSTKNTRVFVERPKGGSLANSLVPLIIHTTNISDSGNWTCRSGNLSETIEILVGEKVNLDVKYEHIDGDEGRSVKLDCTAKGYPLPVVQWYKDRRPITEELVKKYVIRKKEDNYQLEIKNLTHRDSGEYVCRVTQKALSYYTDKRVQVNVQHKPLLVNTLTNDVFTTRYGVQEVYVLINEMKNITCSAIAYPPPTYRWVKRHGSYDEPITDPDTVIHSEDGTSSILQLRVRDESSLGEYKCSANNTRGHVAIVFHVSLGNKPSPPEDANLFESYTDKLVFNVTCSTCNFPSDEETVPNPENLPVSGFKFQMVPVNETYPPDWDTAMEIIVEASNETLYTVGPLPNRTEFHARVCTQNAAGDSEWFVITPNPRTGHAIKLVASLLLLVISVALLHCY